MGGVVVNSTPTSKKHRNAKTVSSGRTAGCLRAGNVHVGRLQIVATLHLCRRATKTPRVDLGLGIKILGEEVNMESKQR